MEKIENPKELEKLRDKLREEIRVRSTECSVTVTVHMGTCGIAAGAREVLQQLMSEIENAELSDVSIRQAGCLGLCDKEPLVVVIDAEGRKFLYGNVDNDIASRIVKEHLVGGSPVKDCMFDK